jgi:hypothetical protein
MRGIIERWLKQLRNKKGWYLVALLLGGVVWFIFGSLEHRFFTYVNDWQDAHTGVAMGLSREILLWLIDHPIIWPVVFVCGILGHAYWKSHRDKASEEAPESMSAPALESSATPNFEGCVFRKYTSMCYGIPNMSSRQYADLMKTWAHQDGVCDCDLLVEMMVENTGKGTGVILTAEARIEHNGKTFNSFSNQDLSRYALSLLEADSPISMLIVGETEPLKSLHLQMTADVPLKEGHKIEGWLRFKFDRIDPDVFESAIRLVIVLHDSRLREHLITKELSLKRQGHVVVNPRSV